MFFISLAVSAAIIKAMETSSALVKLITSKSNGLTFTSLKDPPISSKVSVKFGIPSPNGLQ